MRDKVNYIAILYHAAHTVAPTILGDTFLFAGHVVHRGPFGIAVRYDVGWDTWLMFDCHFRFLMVNQECDAIRFVSLDFLPDTVTVLDPDQLLMPPRAVVEPQVPSPVMAAPPVFKPKSDEIKELVATTSRKDELNNEKVDALIDRIFKLTITNVDYKQREEIQQWVKKFDLARLLTAVDASHAHYFDPKQPRSFKEFFEKIPGIAYLDDKDQRQPYLRNAYYIRGILNKRCSYVGKDVVTKVHELLKSGVPYEKIEKAAKEARNWTGFQETLGMIDAGHNTLTA